MSRTNRVILLAVIGSLGLTATVHAQPVLTSLGNRPSGVSNPQSGTYFIGGSGLRWSLDGSGVLTPSTVPATGGGLISSDGAYQTCASTNGGSIIGYTGVCSPAFSIPNAFADFVLPANGATAARYTAAGGIVTNLPGIPNDAYSQSYQVFGSGDSGQVHNATCMSPNGRFVGVQSYISTYNTNTTTLNITNIACDAGVATVTVSAAHLMAPGNPVTIAGNSVAAYNGTWTVTATPTATTFEFATTCGGTGTGGSISLPAGTRVVASQNFRFRGGIWDGNTNTMRTLSSPFRTSSQTTRRRDTTVWAISNDGTVVVGAQEHNAGATATVADPDGGRLIVWRWNGSDYDMSYLPTGLNAGGFPNMVSTSVGTVHMNGAGTIIVGPSGQGFLAKWVWNSGTSTWDNPIDLGSNLNTVSVVNITCDLDVALATTATDHGLAVNDKVYVAGNSIAGYNGLKTVLGVPSPTTFEYAVTCAGEGTGGTASKAASWLPTAVTSCGVPPTLNITGMSEDGNTIVGFATYSTCGSFQRGGFIWTAADGKIRDWYDHLTTLGVAGLEQGADSTWGPIGDGNDFSKGMPRLGNPSGISSDGSAIVGQQGGNQIIIGAQPWILLPQGSPCVAPAIVSNSTATVNFSRCQRFINLTVLASGSSISFQWHKDGNPLTDGTNGNGTLTTGAQQAALSIVDPTPSDAGNYTCVVTGACGTPATSAASVVQVDPAFPSPANDTCSGAIAVNQGINVLTPPQSPCGAWANDPNFVGCGSPKTDLWYVFTPTVTDNYRIETCGASIDTVLGVFTDCNGSQIACNDDFDSNFGICATGRSRINTVSMTANTPYYIAIGVHPTTNPNTSTTYNLSIFPTTANNDECAGATPAVISTSLASPGNSLNTTEAVAGSASICTATPVAGVRDVWFSYTTPATPACGRIAMTTCPGGGTWNSVIQVFDSCNGTQIACNDNMSTTGAGAPTGCTASSQAGIRALPVTANTTYYIRVGGNAATQFGAGKLHIFVLGDTDGDGARTTSDIPSFITAVMASTYNVFADMNGNGAVNALDIQSFVDCLVQ